MPKQVGTSEASYPGGISFPIYDHNQAYLDKKRNDGTQIFEINKDAVNYWIQIGNNSKRTVAFSVDFGCTVESGANVNWYRRVGSSTFPGIDLCGNQHWWFFKINNSNSPQKYLIKTQHISGMVLDAKDNCSSGWCNVNIYKPESNDQTQLWYLEPAN